jgi:hypothetical protein
MAQARAGMYGRRESDLWGVLRDAEFRAGRGTVPDEFAGIKGGLSPRGGWRIVSQAR